MQTNENPFAQFSLSLFLSLAFHVSYFPLITFLLFISFFLSFFLYFFNLVSLSLFPSEWFDQCDQWKVANIIKSCQNERFLTPLQKLPKDVGILDKTIGAFEKFPKSAINRPI